MAWANSHFNLRLPEIPASSLGQTEATRLVPLPLAKVNPDIAGGQFSEFARALVTSCVFARNGGPDRSTCQLHSEDCPWNPGRVN
jgi:hypothetical protein